MLFLFLLASVAALAAESDQALARRKQYLEDLQTILPRTTVHGLTGRINGHDRTWEDWLTRTGELPPDFESMPSTAGLPDPLQLSDGRRITTAEQWQHQRRWIRTQFEQWIFGKMPPAPGNMRAVVLSEHREGRVTVRQVRLEFGPAHRGRLHLDLMIPDGKGPFPVFLTNTPRAHTWVYTAVRRGYIGCVYRATDPKYGAADDSDEYIDVYPDYDFSCLGRWAWAAMRAVDYLYALPEVDKNKIGITGHSRNGKQALLAAAYDERIGAVIPSSGNTGECLPWRFTPDPYATGTIQGITGGPHNTHWFHPRLRFFAGREHKLPVDQHMLLAMVAPRGLMMYSGYAEHEGNPFGFEQAYRSVRDVYRFLGREENVWLHLRAGEHSTTAADIENFMNFFDTVFGRKKFQKSETWIHGYTFDGWKKSSGESIDPLKYPKRAPGDFHRQDWRRSAVKRIQWALGEEPPGLEAVPRRHFADLPAPDNSLLALLLNRPLKAPGMGARGLPFGDGLKADLYYPLGTDDNPAAGKWPVVVWLHAHSYPTGYSRYAAAALASLTKRGFAVVAFDQLGFGTRVLDAREFYDQYPKWSLMGKMVTDTRAAVKAVSALDVIDPSRIHVVGYGLGAKVALLAAALDSGVKSVASVAGFEALRLQTVEKGTEGLRHYSHLHGLMPRLGFFIDHEDRLPFDFDELVALTAPRPVLLIAPTLDRYAPVGDVTRAVSAAKEVYRLQGRAEALRLETPLEFNRFTRPMQEHVFDWLAAQ